MFSTIIFAIKLIAIGIVVLIAYSIYHAIKEPKNLPFPASTMSMTAAILRKSSIR